MNISALLGLTLSAIQVNDEQDVIKFTADNGRVFSMYHAQDCCERVSIESIVGDLQDLIREPILLAEEYTSQDNPNDVNPEMVKDQESFTWTFYKLATRKGYVDIRWYGGSNGYYSEEVDFMEITNGNE